jgi:23S rRNA (cytosine1962-C5)-methyltransferase
MIRLKLKPGREVSLARRHPWLFSGAVASLEGDGSDGRAVVVDSGGTVRAHGSYSPGSQILARLWTFDGRVPDAALFRERFEAAGRLREAVLPPETTGFRAINSEGDLCPGVLLDIYGDTAVLELLTEGVEKWEAEITGAANEIFQPARLVIRRSGSDRDRGSPPTTHSSQLMTPPVPFTENGLNFSADVSSGQKTGFYLDQRDNRALAATLAAGVEALNAFCYTGGFSLSALKGGARRVVSIDTSEEALALARRNVEINGFDAAKAEWMAADVFAQLRRFRDQGRKFGLIVLDPPKFAPTEKHVPNAARAYKDINLWAMKLLAPGGHLLTFSCSGAVSPDLFQKIVAGAAADARVDLQIRRHLGAAPDHAVSIHFPEGEYLKGLWLQAS